LAAESRLEVDGDPRLLGKRTREALECRYQPEVVEGLRPELDRQSAHVLQRLHHELPQRCTGRTHLLRTRGLLDRLETEQHRGECLAGLVVELPREPPALEL